MNRALSGALLEEIATPESSVLFYETQRAGDNPSGGAGDVASPRHMGGSCYGFADGHAQWLETQPSFAAD
jgi:prepilin-type processing-associated H-X9-DG protein